MAKKIVKNKKTNKPKKRKILKRSNISKIATENKYRAKLNEIEKIYKDYMDKYSKLIEKKDMIFNAFVKKLEERKIEELHKELVNKYNKN